MSFVKHIFNKVWKDFLNKLSEFDRLFSFHDTFSQEEPQKEFSWKQALKKFHYRALSAFFSHEKKYGKEKDLSNLKFKARKYFSIGKWTGNSFKLQLHTFQN